MPFRYLDIESTRAGLYVAKAYDLVIKCEQGHQVRWSYERFADFHKETRLTDICARLVCKTCGSRNGTASPIQNASRRPGEEAQARHMGLSK